MHVYELYTTRPFQLQAAGHPIALPIWETCSMGFLFITFNFPLQCGIQQQQGLNEPREIIPYEESSPSSDVETELFIGLPETRAKRFPSRN